MNVVVVVGDVMNDVVVRPRCEMETGSDTDSEIRRVPGGSGANQAAWLASLGIPVRFYGRAGVFDVDEHAEALRRAGVDARLAADREVPTGNIVVLVSSDGERSMFTDRGANRQLGAADLPRDLDGVAHVHVSGYALFEPPTREAVGAVIDRAVRQSVPVSCDPSSESYLRRMGPERFLAVTAGVRTVFPNAPEARLLARADRGRVEDAARALTAHYPIVAVKLGRRGALLAERDAPTVRVEAPPATVVDTTGAGDAFCAGYLAAAWRGAAALDAVRAGLEASAGAVGHLGGRPELRDAAGDR